MDTYIFQGLWETSTSHFKCNVDPCKPKQDDPTNIPDYLFAEIEQAVLKDLTMQITVPSDVQDDKINPLR